MKLCNIGHSFDYELEKVSRLFLPFEKIEVVHLKASGENIAVAELLEENGEHYALVTLQIFGKVSRYKGRVSIGHQSFNKECELELARGLYNCFADIMGYKADWGILTGIRPAKLFSSLEAKLGKERAKESFFEDYLVSPSKISLCQSAVRGESKIISYSKPQSFSLYISIPFCPSRCSYCSFVSHSIDKAADIIPEYIEHLCREIKITADIAKRLKLRLETVYMGGGTPTTLSAEALDKVLSLINQSFDMSNVREFTVEAGRADTITEAKLLAIKKNGATRISINPQSMNDRVLEKIGRRHTAAQTVEAFTLARRLGFDNINMDVIAALPDESLDEFKKTIEDIIELSPENVTVHTLSMKRASTLTAKGEQPDFEAGSLASQMVDYARRRLTENGILPYYMYRQSKTVGNLENVGYSKVGYEGLYNVYIMDETHTILAVGASAVTKLRNPQGKEIERIFNFKYPFEYISRFDEIISRKEGIEEFYDKYATNDKRGD